MASLAASTSLVFAAWLFGPFAHEFGHDLFAHVLQVRELDLWKYLALAPVDLDELAHIAGVDIDSLTGQLWRLDVSSHTAVVDEVEVPDVWVDSTVIYIHAQVTLQLLS